MTKRSTKSALLLSLLSLVLCVSMLMGTTFAWFTDSVTSANNIIKAGNLDVDVYYGDPANKNTISGVDKLFSDVKLWEPGAMAWEQLTVVNLGNLALKYTMNVNFTNATKNGEGKTLADILKVAVLAQEPTRESIQSATLIPMKDFDLGKDNVALAPGASQGFYLAIYWEPSAIDNEFTMNNGKGAPLTIDLGINLFATQVEAEEDSFGPDYDKDAEYDSNAVVDGNATASTTLGTENTKVEIPAGAEGGTYVLETTEIKTETDANGVVTATMDITLFRNGEKAEATDPTKPFVVTVNIGAGLNLTKVLHNNVELTDYTYDIATGDVIFKTTHFSPFSFIYNNGADVATLDELLAALATDTRVINLKNDIEASEVVLIGRSVMINGNGYKVTSNATRVFRVTTNDVDVILNDVNMVSTAVRVGSNDVRGISIDIVENVKLTLNNCTVDFTDASANDWAYAVNVTGGANHTVTVNGGAYEGANVINVRSAKSAVTVKNATLTSTYPNTEAYIDLNYFGACIYVLKNQETSVYASGNTYIGDNAVAYNLGVGNFLEEGDNVDNATSLAVEARIGGAIYDTLAKAVAAANAGDKVVLIRDIVSADGVLITDKNITIDLNGKTFTVTEGASTNNRNFKVNGTSEVTIKNGTMIAAGELTSGAYGTVRTEGAAKVTLENLKLYSYRGYGLNVKAYSGTTIVINDCEIYAQYSGGVEAAGGTIELNNTKIEQKGIYSSAAWCSVAIGVNGGGKVIVNSGDYSASAISTDANAAQGTWVAYVMSSGGTLEINGGTFNGVVAETATAANACGVICADRAAVVNINGGTFNSNGAILDMRNNVGSLPNPVATLAGGAFSADPRVSGLYSSNLITVAEGYEVAETNGVWTVTAK